MLIRKTCDNGVVLYESPLLSAAGLPHGFSTRVGGVSAGPFASMNLGNPSGSPVVDHLNNIRQNYERFQAAIGCADRPRAQVHQVHGGGVSVAATGVDFDIHAKADAIVTDDPGQVLSVRTADCVPVLIGDRAGTRVAAVHAGWRGVIAGVVVNALQHFDHVENVIVAIGPSIGPLAFEVGPEVRKEFVTAFGQSAPVRDGAGDRSFIDLRAAIAMQCQTAGVSLKQIDATDCCTVTEAEEFFSHRRDNGVTGRMAAMIGPRKPGKR